eukprot:1156389-Pelagomonas_calceolata.AAC.6
MTVLRGGNRLGPVRICMLPCCMLFLASTFLITAIRFYSLRCEAVRLPRDSSQLTFPKLVHQIVKNRTRISCEEMFWMNSWQLLNRGYRCVETCNGKNSSA